MRKFFIVIFLSLFFLSTSTSVFNYTADARRGCCSHHGGVCGCECCDGSGLSDICAPYYPSCNSNPTYPVKRYQKKYYKPAIVRTYNCQTMVTTSTAWILNKPNLYNKKILKTLNKNVKVVKTGGYQNDFLQVKVENTKVKGWIHKLVCSCL